MGETTIIKIPKVCITKPQKAWVRKVLKDSHKKKLKMIKEKETMKRKGFIKVKLCPSEKLKKHKIKKRMYDIKYYLNHKEEINLRQRRNYHLHKKESNTKFI